MNRCITNEFDIEQSPLSDDETNPINEHVTEVADIDLEEMDENNSLFPSIPYTAFINSNIVLNSFATSSFLISCYQSPQFSFRKTSQSYLNVFRI